jgi:hypothetical protein
MKEKYHLIDRQQPFFIWWPMEEKRDLAQGRGREIVLDEQAAISMAEKSVSPRVLTPPIRENCP